MGARYDAIEEPRGDGDPFVAEADVIGLYHPDRAAVTARGSMTDQGSGQWRWDD